LSLDATAIAFSIQPLFIQRRAGVDKRFRFLGFIFGDLDEDTAGGEGVAIEAQGRKFIGDDRMEFGGFKPGTDELSIGGVEGAVNGYEGHKEKAKG
jgi:hypothetical protein